MTKAHTRLPEWSERFRKAPLARKVVVGLEGHSQEIWRRTFDLLKEESPEYRNAVDDEFTEESRSHCGERLAAIIAIAAGRLKDGDPFAFVRRHAEWRARHQVPLVASLHAYRLAHKTYWGITRETLARRTRQKESLHALTILSDFWIELFEVVGAVLEEAHISEEARAVAENTRAYTALIDDLLSGNEPANADARQLRVLCGMRPGMKMAIAVFRPFAADRETQVDVDVRLRSLIRLLHQVLPSAIFGKLATLRSREVLMVVGSDGETAGRFLKLLARHGFGKKRGAGGVGVGAAVSLDKREVAELPDALAEALMAADLVSVVRPLIHFSDIDLTEFLIQRADKAALRLIPGWAHTADGQTHELFRTVRTFADCNLNVKETARRMSVHTNTVYFRLNQIKKRTGVDPRTFSGTSFLLTLSRLLETHTHDKERLTWNVESSETRKQSNN